MLAKKREHSTVRKLYVLDTFFISAPLPSRQPRTPKPQGLSVYSSHNTQRRPKTRIQLLHFWNRVQVIQLCEYVHTLVLLAFLLFFYFVFWTFFDRFFWGPPHPSHLHSAKIFDLIFRNFYIGHSLIEQVRRCARKCPSQCFTVSISVYRAASLCNEIDVTSRFRALRCKTGDCMRCTPHAPTISPIRLTKFIFTLQKNVWDFSLLLRVG